MSQKFKIWFEMNDVRSILNMIWNEWHQKNLKYHLKWMTSHVFKYDQKWMMSQACKIWSEINDVKYFKYNLKWMTSWVFLIPIPWMSRFHALQLMLPQFPSLPSSVTSFLDGPSWPAFIWNVSYCHKILDYLFPWLLFLNGNNGVFLTDLKPFT